MTKEGGDSALFHVGDSIHLSHLAIHKYRARIHETNLRAEFGNQQKAQQFVCVPHHDIDQDGRKRHTTPGSSSFCRNRVLHLVLYPYALQRRPRRHDYLRTPVNRDTDRQSELFGFLFVCSSLHFRTLSKSKAEMARNCTKIPLNHEAQSSDFFSQKHTLLLDMNKLTTGLILVGISLVLLALCTYGVLRFYREKSVGLSYSFMIYITW